MKNNWIFTVIIGCVLMVISYGVGAAVNSPSRSEATYELKKYCTLQKTGGKLNVTVYKRGNKDFFKYLGVISVDYKDVEIFYANGH